ncbi:MAG: hypothetical protein K2X27_06335, partial [Candidatus Obscuribacterales bacterium]|nr:hypothetical protein [Candidatus Obscuribacterales bacterium]
EKLAAKITPQAFVWKNGRLVYSGRIDDRYAAIGQRRSVIVCHDLKSLLSDLDSGKNLVFKETQAIGCFLESPKKKDKDHAL